MSSREIILRVRHHVSHQVVAYLALLVALTGTAVGATYWVTGRTIVDGSVTSVDIRNKSLHIRDLSPRARRWIRAQYSSSGTAGTSGLQGIPGPTGATGLAGSVGPAGAEGQPGVDGVDGADGADGADGLAGAPGRIAFAEFYSLMPPNNPATIAGGVAIDFTQDGASFGGIVRNGNSSFVLPTVGIYMVVFQASITEAGQLVLALDTGAGPVVQDYTAIGRATGTNLIIGHALVTTTVANTELSVRNPNAGVLTLTPFAGGALPTAAVLVIEQLQ